MTLRPAQKALIQEILAHLIVCGLYPRGFVTEASEEAPILARDGSNFTAWYRSVSAERQSLVAEYIPELRKVVEGLQGIRLEKVGQETRAFMVELGKPPDAYELRLDELSDGQRSLVALYALVRLGAGSDGTLFLDEPDNYVALPELQPGLMSLKDAAGVELPQVVIATHHPELIDYLGAEAGLWLDREEGGPTRVGKIEPPSDGTLKLSELIARGWNG